MFNITSECIKCGACSETCPVGAISEGDAQFVISEECIDCGTCAESCPVEAIKAGK